MAQTMSILSPKDYIWTVSLADEQDYAKFPTFQWDGLWANPKLIEEKVDLDPRILV